MNARAIARIVGVLFLVAGVAGFVPPISPVAPFDAPVVTLGAAYRLLFGVFPVNAVSDGAHVLFGVWGVLAGARFGAAAVYCRCTTWVCLFLAVLGSIPLLGTLFGIAPVYGYDVALYAAVTLLCAYGGYGRGSKAETPAPIDRIEA
jgi:hypothetical protein